MLLLITWNCIGLKPLGWRSSVLSFGVAIDPSGSYFIDTAKNVVFNVDI